MHVREIAYFCATSPNFIKFASHRGIYLSLAGSGGHEPVELRVLGDGIGEGHQGAADPQ